MKTLRLMLRVGGTCLLLACNGPQDDDTDTHDETGDTDDTDSAADTGDTGETDDTGDTAVGGSRTAD